MNEDQFNTLTPEEERVIVHKGTERPYTGEYDNFFWMALIYVGDVTLLCMSPKTNFTAVVGGLVLTTSYLEL